MKLISKIQFVLDWILENICFYLALAEVPLEYREEYLASLRKNKK